MKDAAEHDDDRRDEYFIIGGPRQKQQQSWCRSVPSVVAARLAAPMTTYDTQSEPHQRPEQCHHDAEQPQRPGEAPDQEVERDVLGVLDHEDEQQPDFRALN